MEIKVVFLADRVSSQQLSNISFEVSERWQKRNWFLLTGLNQKAFKKRFMAMW